MVALLKKALLVGVVGGLAWFLPALLLPDWVAQIALGLPILYVTAIICDVIGFSRPRTLLPGSTARAVFVTGCDSGFGHSTASRLASLGFQVFAGCLDPEGEGAASLRRESGLVEVFKCDVTEEDQVREAFDIVSQKLKHSNRSLWAVVNNAGIATLGEIELLPMSAIRRTFEVNTFGPALVTKTFLPLLREGGGRVVIVASLAGRFSLPGMAVYCMSKHAAVSLADGLRIELKKWGISVHTIEPSTYKTEIVNVERTNKTMDLHWEELPSETRESYGSEYLANFKVRMAEGAMQGKAADRIGEVVDDIVDATCGSRPRSRYVPCAVTHFRSEVMRHLPTQLLDSVMNRRCGTTALPAALRGKAN